MRPHAWATLTAALWLGASAALFAAEGASTPPSVISLSWKDIQQAVDQHPALLAAQHHTAAAKVQAQHAGRPPAPDASLEYALARPREVSSLSTPGPEWRLALSMPLDWVLTRGAEKALAQAGVEDSQAEAQVWRVQVLLRLKHLYWGLAHDQALVAVLTETERQVAQLSTLIQLRVDKGEARPIEVPRMETELYRVRGALEEAQTQAQVHQDQLALELGLDPTRSRLLVTADMASLPKLPSLEQAQAHLEATHPLLQGARAKVQTAEANLQLSLRKRSPGVSLSVFAGRELDTEAAGASLDLALPSWGLQRGAVAQARAEKAGEIQRLEATRRELSALLIERYQLCAQDRRTVMRFREILLPRAEQVARSVETSFRLGETSLLDVLDARRVLLDVSREHQAAQRQLHENCTELAALTGALDHE